MPRGLCRAMPRLRNARSRATPGWRCMRSTTAASPGCASELDSSLFADPRHASIPSRADPAAGADDGRREVEHPTGERDLVPRLGADRCTALGDAHDQEEADRAVDADVVHTNPSVPTRSMTIDATNGPTKAPAPNSTTSCDAAAVSFSVGTQSLV